MNRPLHVATTPGVPRAYRPGLAPLPSTLRPRCHAKDRTRLWLAPSEVRAADAHGRPLPSVEQDIARAPLIISRQIEESTRESYGTALLLFAVYCDARRLSEHARCPASHTLLVGFVSAFTGSYTGDTLSQFLSGLRHWSAVHSVRWLGEDGALGKLCRGADKFAPKALRRIKRGPATTALLLAILAQLDPDVPLDAACRAALLVAFFSLARLGELTVKNERAFDRDLHATKAGVKPAVSREGNPVRPRAPARPRHL
jgi:hypothetical protein